MLRKVSAPQGYAAFRYVRQGQWEDVENLLTSDKTHDYRINVTSKHV